MKPEAVTLFLVNVASIMEKADESLLPGAYKEVGASLHADPTGLGSLTLLRSIVQSACYPVAVYLAARYNRAHVISIGAFLWAGATFLVGFSSTFGQVAVSRALNGIGLAIVAPAIQSLVADSTDDNNRGTAFGWLQLTGNVGSVVGGLCSVMIAPITFMGIPGWRISFHIVGVISVVVGILVRIYAKDPLYKSSNGAKNLARSASFSSGLKTLIQEGKSGQNSFFSDYHGSRGHGLVSLVRFVICSYVVGVDRIFAQDYSSTHRSFYCCEFSWWVIWWLARRQALQ